MEMKLKIQKIKSIVITDPAPKEKQWVHVTFENGTEWRPGFVDLGEIISKIGKCEDIKYPTGQGYRVPQRFFHNVYNKTREQIIQLYEDIFNPNKMHFSK